MLIYFQVIETDDDKSKFEAIYKTYYGLMYHIAFKKLSNPQDAEDVVHHVFMKIAENIKKLSRSVQKRILLSLLWYIIELLTYIEFEADMK